MPVFHHSVGKKAIDMKILETGELERLFWRALRARQAAHVALALRAARHPARGDFGAELLLLRDDNLLVRSRLSSPVHTRDKPWKRASSCSSCTPCM